MKKILVFTAIIITLVVAFNIHSRSAPELRLDNIFPWLEGRDLLLSAADVPLQPGLYAFWYMGLTPRTSTDVAIISALSWAIWLFLFRTFIFCIAGRWAGFYSPDIYHWFTIPAWRPVARRLLLPLFWWYEEIFLYGVEASARFASPFEMVTMLYRPGDIPLGRCRILGFPLFQPIGTPGKLGRHGVMIAGTGGGKTNFVRSIIGLSKSNGIYIDPRADMAEPLLARMGQGDEGILGKNKRAGVFDPSNLVAGFPTWRWNPFIEVYEAMKRARKRAIKHGRDPELAAEDAKVEFCQKILEGLIIPTGGDKFFTGAARDLCLSVMLWMIKSLAVEEVTLEKFYALISVGLPGEARDPKTTGIDMLLARLLQAGGIIASGAAGVAEASSNTASSVLITIREALQWIKRPALQSITSRSDFTLAELHPAHGNLVLFITCKLSDIREAFPGLFRLLTVLTMAVFEDINTPTSTPTLMVLDEFANLGYISAAETALPYARSFGLRIICVIQNPKQLEAVGYKNPETFIGNAEVCWWMASEAADSLAYLENALGKSTITERLDGPPWWLSPFVKERSRHGRREREVLTKDQIKRLLARGAVIVTRPGRALLLAPDPYFKMLPVAFYKRAKYPETLGRTLGRAVFKLFVREKSPR